MNFLEPKPKWWRSSIWPQIYDMDSAREAAKVSAYAAFFCAGITALFAVLSIAGVNLISYISMWSLLDAVIFLGFGIGTKKMSRVCSVLLLAFYVLEKIASLVEGHFQNPLIWLLFIALFTSGVRGCFAYHQFSQHPETEPVL